MTGLRDSGLLYSVVGVIPKEGLVGPQPANPSLGMTTTEICLFSHTAALFDMGHEKTDLKAFVVVILKEGLVGWGAANPSFGYDTDYKNITLLLS